MSLFPARRSRAPRLFVKILGASFAVIAIVLLAVFLPLTMQAQARLLRATSENLEASQIRFQTEEDRRQREQSVQAQLFAENTTLKAAVDTYQAEHGQGGDRGQLINTIRLELSKLQRLIDVPSLSVSDNRGVILASVGPRSGDWPEGDRELVRVGATAKPVDAVVMRGPQAYLTTVVPLALRDELIGQFFLATPLNDAYARNLPAGPGTDIAILINGRGVVAGSIPTALRQAVERKALPESGKVELNDKEYVVTRLFAVDAASVYALSSISDAMVMATTNTASVLVAIGIGALLLAAIASWWLASTLASPIHDLTRTLADMASKRDFDRPLPASGVSLELDALAETFDALRTAVTLAEAESEATYLGVIGALAAALDARDPYTSGHSDRVATLSVALGRQMQLPEADIETLRLGALLHDIGKIGVSDAVLRKPGTLTPDEFEQIKLHPSLGARILKPLRFLSDHLAIVELHHEQPDGRGYPHGLKGDQIPRLASIVRVADAFDAITTARAYRPARLTTEAMAELWSHAGTGFEPHVVQAMAAVPEAILTHPPASREETNAAAAAAISGALVPFRARAAASARESVG